jgi:uncharacterized iron-regulated membrane protein
LVGEEPPAQGGPAASASPAIELPKPAEGTKPLSRELQFAAVQKEYPQWQQITLRLSTPARGRPSAATPNPALNPPGGSNAERPSGPQPLNFIVKLPDAWPRTATTTAVMNPFTGDLLRRETFSDLTTGRQVRTWTRFLHTGEAVGWMGQTVAGMASLGGCVLVYTGFALAWRRFFGKRAPENGS